MSNYPKDSYSYNKILYYYYRMNPEQLQNLQPTAEDLLYEVIDEMTESQLKVLMKDIQDEIELRKYKATRVKKMKDDLDKEFEKLLKKNNDKAKKPTYEEESDEEPQKKPIKRVIRK